jgi:hypothetical protein
MASLTARGSLVQGAVLQPTLSVLPAPPVASLTAHVLVRRV